MEAHRPESATRKPSASLTRRLMTVLMIALLISSGYSLFFKQTVRRAVRRLFTRPSNQPYTAEEFLRDVREALQPRRSAYLDFAFHALAFVVSVTYLAAAAAGRWRRSGPRSAN
jgi:hypothetical protein